MFSSAVGGAPSAVEGGGKVPLRVCLFLALLWNVRGQYCTPERQTRMVGLNTVESCEMYRDNCYVGDHYVITEIGGGMCTCNCANEGDDCSAVVDRNQPTRCQVQNACGNGASITAYHPTQCRCDCVPDQNQPVVQNVLQSAPPDNSHNIDALEMASNAVHCTQQYAKCLAGHGKTPKPDLLQADAPPANGTNGTADDVSGIKLPPGMVMAQVTIGEDWSEDDKQALQTLLDAYNAFNADYTTKLNKHIVEMANGQTTTILGHPYVGSTHSDPNVAIQQDTQTIMNSVMFEFGSDSGILAFQGVSQSTSKTDNKSASVAGKFVEAALGMAMTGISPQAIANLAGLASTSGDDIKLSFSKSNAGNFYSSFSPIISYDNVAGFGLNLYYMNYTITEQTTKYVGACHEHSTESISITASVWRYSLVMSRLAKYAEQSKKAQAWLHTNTKRVNSATSATGSEKAHSISQLPPEDKSKHGAFLKNRELINPGDSVEFIIQGLDTAKLRAFQVDGLFDLTVNMSSKSPLKFHSLSFAGKIVLEEDLHVSGYTNVIITNNAKGTTYISLLDPETDKEETMIG